MNTIELTPTETAAIMIGRIASLSVGETLELTGGRVVRVKRSEYCLHADNNKERARWGTQSEIEGDVATFLATGFLPKANGGRW